MGLFDDLYDLNIASLEEEDDEDEKEEEVSFTPLAPPDVDSAEEPTKEEGGLFLYS